MFHLKAMASLLTVLLVALPAWSVAARGVRKATGIERGVTVMVDGQLDLAADLAGKRQMVVHLLVPRAEQVATLRAQIHKQGLGGLVIVDALATDGLLPHPDRFVNLFVADLDTLGSRGPTEDEVKRVLAVRGCAYLRRKGKWQTITRPHDPDIDGWFARWYDASGNCVSRDRIAGFPKAVQWQHGPAMEDGTTDGKVTRVANGRLLTVHVSTGDLLCRDAGNGTLLWRAQVGLRPNGDFVVVKDRIYLFASTAEDKRKRTYLPDLIALDLLSGKKVQTYKEGVRVGSARPQDITVEGRTRKVTPEPWFVVNDRVIVQAYDTDLAVLDRNTGRRLWQQKLKGASWFSPILFKDLVLAVEAIHPGRRRRHDGSSHARAVVAYNLDDGQQRWRNENIHPLRTVQDKKRGRFFTRAELKPLSAAEGLVLVHVSSYQFRGGGSVAVLEANTGKQLWRREFAPKSLYTQGSQRAVIRNREVIVLDGTGAYRFAARTGKPLGEPLTKPKKLRRQARLNGACTASRATIDWLFCNATFYIGPGGKVQTCFGARGSCGQGVIPANGLVYVPPTACDCGDYARGYQALTSKPSGHPVQDAQRLQKGPAYAVNRQRKPDTADRESWPIFLGTPQRSLAHPQGLDSKLRILWTQKVTSLRESEVNTDRQISERHLGALSAPVVGSHLVLASAPEEHVIYALDARTGKRQWVYPTGGKVDSPPTLAGGLAVFGCEDGHVCAVDTKSGKLAWKFCTTPTDAVALQHGHLASAFPLPGSVMILGDTVIAVAGQHTDLGGLHCWVLDLNTGNPRVRRTIRANQSRVVSNGLVVADGDGKGFWIGQQLHLSLELKDLPADRWKDPRPPVWMDRNGTRIRFRTNQGRGGSTHGWKGAMRLRGRNRLLNGHRMVATARYAYGLNDPTQGRNRTPVVWAVPRNATDKMARWQLSPKDLGNHESYGAILLAGENLYLGGGSRDGRKGVLHVVEAKTGKVLAHHTLPARVTECGLAVAHGRLYVCCENGTVVCLGS